MITSANDKPGFEEVNLPVKLQPIAVEEALIEIQKTPIICRKQALIPKVVYGQDGPNRSKAWIALGLCLEKGDCERCLPVVRMKDIGHTDLSKQFKSGPAEESKPFRIVGIVAFGSAVEVTRGQNSDRHESSRLGSPGRFWR